MVYQFLNTASNSLDTVDNLVCCLRQIFHYVVPVSYDERAIDVKNRFLTESDLHCLPVLKDGSLYGLLNRHRFMENHMVGKYGFGYHLNYYKPIGQLVEDCFIKLDQNTTIEHAAKLIASRDRVHMYDDICITDEDKYAGIISVSDVLSAITKNNLILAIGANPLSGLPGNDFIQRNIRNLLTKQESFDICYIDIDSFKPFNDQHGFAKGDEVIKAVAEIMVAEMARYESCPLDFVGHIGGDDFIMVSTPEKSVSICLNIIRQFDNRLAQFHGESEALVGYYQGINRKGECERFPLLALSIAIISTEIRKYSSYAEISSIASGLKKKAKQQSGSVVIRDQRLL